MEIIAIPIFFYVLFQVGKWLFDDENKTAEKLSINIKFYHMSNECKDVEFKFNSVQELESFLSYLRSEKRLSSVSEDNVSGICDADYQNWRDSLK